MSIRPPTDGAVSLIAMARWRERYSLLTRTRRELVLLGVMLLTGLIVMPFLIWVAGSRILGPYVHGQNPHAGPLALFGDFLLGLLHGSAVFWAVALGPAALLFGFRLFLALMRTLP